MISYARRKSSNEPIRKSSLTCRVGRATRWSGYNKTMICPDLLEILACPVCRKPLVLRGEEALKCNECKRVYPIRNDIPILLEHEATIEQF